MALPLKHPFTCLVVGPTGSGKSYFVSRLLQFKDTMIAPTPDKVFWCYGEYQPLFQEVAKFVPDIRILQGFPEEIEQEIDKSQNNLVIIDDLQSEISGSRRLSNIFSKGSHHRSISVIFIQQNLFYQGKESKNIRLNCQYLVLFKSPSDRQQISILARQIQPKGSQYMIEAYDDATKLPFSYLFLDHKPDTDDRLRIRSNIFPGETHFVYVRKV